MNKTSLEQRINWEQLLAFYGCFMGKNKPCPFCGGEDRFCYNGRGRGYWICRQCQPTGGDGWKLLERTLGISFKKVVDVVKDYLGEKPLKLKPVFYTYSSPIEKNPILPAIIPAPNPIGKIDLSFPFVLWDSKGLKQNRFQYQMFIPWLTAKGELIGYVGRTEKKITHQIYWTEKGWTQGTLGKDRPLLGLEDLNKYDMVVITEGEKCQQYAKRKFPDVCSLTWIGGAQAWHLSDWSVIKGKKVLIYPDNDEKGKKASAGIAERISAVNWVTVAEIPEGKPEGWDIADE